MTSQQASLAAVRFGAGSTALDVVAGVDLTGQRAVVTGGASGIGLETARALAATGADVTLAVRDPARAAAAVTDIRNSTGNALIRAARLDLADPASIAEFSGAWAGPLHVLVNNAGIMAVPQLVRTPQGWESQFAVNHLGHAALTLGLHAALTRPGSARIVQVASSAHLMAPVDFTDINFERRPYDPWAAYGQSKTAAILFTVALAQRWADDGITANALHPGGIMTGLQRHLDDAQLAYVGAKDASGHTLAVPPGWKTVQQGAATSALLAASPLVDKITGRYFEDCAEAAPQPEPAPGQSGVAAYATDPGLALRLWAATMEALGYDH
jgi:NAD(P)-dependent dehydrogenase (short-subunit alcohol dehydrogenase family)